MKKGLPVILFLLVIILLGCTPSTRVANAGDYSKYDFPVGSSLEECKVLSLNPPLSIGFRRNKDNVCEIEKIKQKGEEVHIRVYESLYCDENEIGQVGPEVESKDEKLPDLAFSGGGNQFCPEAFVLFTHSPHCYKYTIGGRTYYLPSKKH